MEYTLGNTKRGMALKDLFLGFDVQIVGNEDTEVLGICCYSNDVQPGDLFVARKGQIFDGHAFIHDALKRGTVAVLMSPRDDFRDNSIPRVICSDWFAIQLKITDRFYGSPTRDLFLVGVTGTNGKTTTTYFIRELLESCGLMGTIEVSTGTGETYPSDLTTTNLLTTQKYMREMVNMGLRNAVIEVSSAALDQDRVKGLHFDIALFTNLSQDHMDYHGNMLNYLKTKQKLFKSIDDQQKIDIVNADDTCSHEITKNCRAKVITFGLNNPADFRAKDIKLSLDRSKFKLVFDNQEYVMTINMLGQHNILNALAAIAVAHTCGINIDDMREKLALFPGVCGRLQGITNYLGLKVFIDNCHTPDSLKLTLSLLYNLKKGRIITVFGCGGCRDRSERPLMAEQVEMYSDVAIVTSDNNRMESHKQISADIFNGFTSIERVIHECDRRLAIEMAVGLAKYGDTVPVAGRGHERYLHDGGEIIPFYDPDITREILQETYRNREYLSRV